MSLKSERRAQLLNEVICESLDKLATLDLHGRGIVEPIYRHIRVASGGKPLSYSFAKALIAAAAPGRVAIIATGFMIRKAMQPETDGLTGAAYLSRVLAMGLGLKPLILCEDGAVEASRAAMSAAGLEESSEEADSSKHGGNRSLKFTLLGFPASGIEGSLARETELRKKVKSTEPCLFLTIERPGMNNKGVPHTTFGASVGDISARIDDVLGDMKDLGVPTFAVGDLGNELGMGCVKAAVTKLTPFGCSCSCGCGGGVAAEADADFAMMGSVSDDACYAIGAAVALMAGRLDLLPEGKLIGGILEKAVEAGAVDGLTAQNRRSIDIIPWEVHEVIIGLMRDAVLQAIEHDKLRPQFIDHLAAIDL